MNLSEKLILVDADGVLLDWFYQFNNWMNQHGHKIVYNDRYRIEETYNIPKADAKFCAKMFNESARIGYVPPFRDAIKYVKKLHEEHGYVFHCITSLSTDEYAVAARTANIRRLFGETAFEKIICLETGADKDEALLPYKDSGCFWVEDKFENAIAGLNAGLTPLLMDHGHNRPGPNPEDLERYKDIQRVYNWKHIYDVVTGG